MDRFIALETNFEKKNKGSPNKNTAKKKVVTYLCRFNNNNNNEMIEKVSSTILTKRNETKRNYIIIENLFVEVEFIFFPYI